MTQPLVAEVSETQTGWCKAMLPTNVQLRYQVCHLTICACPSPLPFNKHSTLGLIM